MVRTRTPPRGSTLLLVIILLAILAFVGVAAVRLGSQERVNAAAKGKRDYLVACANAARIQLWTELTRSGSKYLQSTSVPATLTLDDGTELSAPSAPSGSPKDGLPVVDLVQLVPMVSTAAGGSRDATNTILGSRQRGASGGVRMVARCRDPMGRELLVEFTTRFAL